MDNHLPTLTIFIYLEIQGGNGSLEEDSLVGAFGKSQIVNMTSAFHDIVVQLLSHIWLLVTQVDCSIPGSPVLLVNPSNEYS